LCVRGHAVKKMARRWLSVAQPKLTKWAANSNVTVCSRLPAKAHPPGKKFTGRVGRNGAGLSHEMGLRR
jgi:hypothetical protein